MYRISHSERPWHIATESLSITKQEALDYIKEDDRITEADLYIAKPGDKIRMCPVKEAIEPRIRPDGRSVFPGHTGRT